MEEERPAWEQNHHSAKRIKLNQVGEADSVTALHPPIYRSVSSESDHHYQQQQQYQQNRNYPEQQNAGQISSERQTPLSAETGNYHSMNHMLGSLHMMRRRQRASEAGVHQPSQQIAANSALIRQQQPQTDGYPQRKPSSTKKVVSLRIDSNLY